MTEFAKPIEGKFMVEITRNFVEVEFIMIKNNLTTRTKSLSCVQVLSMYGWKIKHNELSGLL